MWQPLSFAIAIMLSSMTTFGQDVEGGEQPAGPDPLRDARTEVYKNASGHDLKLYIFEPKTNAAEPRPAIVFFFGGGWVNGNPRQFAHHCRYLAERGMVAITAEYRIRSIHGTTPFESVADAKSVMRFLRANAERLGIDANRIAAGGGSAGGHIAAAAATVPGLDDAGDDASVSCVPNALVLFNPVYDNGPSGYGHDRVNDRYREISPIDNIRPGIPPTIVFLGTRDKLVPVETAERFQTRSREAGSRSELVLFEGQPHGFFNFGKDGNVHYRQTVEAVDRFLVSLGYLAGEPTIASP